MKKRIINHTHALEFLFEFGLVLAVGDAEVVIRIFALVDAVRRDGGADGEHGGRALSPLSAADLLHGHHFCFFFWLAGEK